MGLGSRDTLVVLPNKRKIIWNNRNKALIGFRATGPNAKAIKLFQGLDDKGFHPELRCWPFIVMIVVIIYSSSSRTAFGESDQNLAESFGRMPESDQNVEIWTCGPIESMLDLGTRDPAVTQPRRADGAQLHRLDHSIPYSLTVLHRWVC